jgi:hypothetical protein
MRILLILSALAIAPSAFAQDPKATSAITSNRPATAEAAGVVMYCRQYPNETATLAGESVSCAYLNKYVPVFCSASGHVYTVMMGHVVLQVLSWHPEPPHAGKIIRFRADDGPWDKLAIQIWPIEEKSVTWPPPMSLSTVVGVTHYGYFRVRFNNEKGHLLLTPKAKQSPHRP